MESKANSGPNMADLLPSNEWLRDCLPDPWAFNGNDQTKQNPRQPGCSLSTDNSAHFSCPHSVTVTFLTVHLCHLHALLGVHFSPPSQYKELDGRCVWDCIFLRPESWSEATKRSHLTKYYLLQMLCLATTSTMAHTFLLKVRRSIIHSWHLCLWFHFLHPNGDEKPSSDVSYQRTIRHVCTVHAGKRTVRHPWYEFGQQWDSIIFTITRQIADESASILL